MQFHKGFGNIVHFVLILFSLYLVCLASWRFVSEKHVSMASVKKNLQTQKIRRRWEDIWFPEFVNCCRKTLWRWRHDCERHLCPLTSFFFMVELSVASVFFSILLFHFHNFLFKKLFFILLISWLLRVYRPPCLRSAQ